MVEIRNISDVVAQQWTQIRKATFAMDACYMHPHGNECVLYCSGQTSLTSSSEQSNNGNTLVVLYCLRPLLAIRRNPPLEGPAYYRSIDFNKCRNINSSCIWNKCLWYTKDKNDHNKDLSLFLSAEMQTRKCECFVIFPWLCVFY